ncbi:MAG: hypothetical protein L6406_00195, partial [Desulfobacterales bacterium]|nr:hypothetical protein [Desulfobacterales bacterium]
MSDWEKLKGIVDELENVVHSPYARNTALNKLARSNIHMLTKELLGEKQLNKTDDRFQVFNKLFGVADLFVYSGQKHPIFGDLADIAEKLASDGRYFPHAPIFLERILKRYATTREDANQGEIAFKGLVAGINKSHEDLSRISAQILSF